MKVLFFTNTVCDDSKILVKELQYRHNIEIDLLHDPDKLEYISRGEYNLLVSDRSNCIFSNKILTLFENAINTHPSMLPSHKGSYPLFWSVILNDTLGVTIHEIGEQIDTGTVLFRKTVQYSSCETFRNVYDRCRKTIESMLSQYIFCIKHNTTLSSDPYVPSSINAFTTNYWHKKAKVNTLMKKLPLGWDTVILEAQAILREDIDSYVNSAIATLQT